MQRLYFAMPDPTSPNLSPTEVYTTPELAFPLNGVEMEDGQRRPYLYFNMVSSVDGKATTIAENATGLGSDLDREFMYRLRAASEAVMCGAATFRRDEFLPAVKPWLAEERAHYFPNNPQPLACVVSNDGNLPLTKKFWQAGRDLRVVFLGPKASMEQEKILAERAQVFRLEVDAKGQPDLKQMLEIFYQKLGVRRLLVEGGPTLNYNLIEQGLADELFWTLAPKIVAGSDNLSMVMGPGRGLPLDKIVKLQLLSIYNNDSELFMRYRLIPLEK